MRDDPPRGRVAHVVEVRVASRALRWSFTYHAATVKLLRLTIVPIVAISLAAVACTGDDAPAPAPASSPSTSPGEGVQASDVGDIDFKPGRFSYNFNGIKASLSMDGSTGTLEVSNDSGQDLGKPGMYVIARDGQRYTGSVEAAAPIADGGNGTFQVTFPAQVTPDTVGLAVLLFGGSNAGALAPVPLA